MTAKPDAPRLDRYHSTGRAELLDFIREVYSPADSARIITQWPWRYERSPFTPEEGPSVYLLRIGNTLAGMVAAFRTPMWMGGIECIAECRGIWIVHPDYRGRNLWRKVRTRADESPVRIGWSRLPPRIHAGVNWFSNPVRPLVRILDAGQVASHFTHSRTLGSIFDRADSAIGFIARRFRRIPQLSVARLGGFDERADALWLRARRPAAAMTVRNHRYLNWRYCERPDATYLLYGAERGSELEGFLVARAGEFRGIRWGYVVDFLAPEKSPEVLVALVEAAVDEFRRLGVAAITCYATDRASRAALFRGGFFPAPQRKPIRFTHFLSSDRTDLGRFKPLESWYVTAGDGDLEMSP